MARKYNYTPEELLDAEIERLKKTEAVKLAQKEQRFLYRNRKYLSDLHWVEKNGKKLLEEGLPSDTIKLLFRDVPYYLTQEDT